MPGAYTHITMANVASEPVSLEAIPDFPRDAIRACSRWLGFCELGAVSPDYPYLQVMSAGAKSWADKMHYVRTGNIIKTVVRRLRRASPGNARQQGIAWILGYTVHVVMDVTIHPVINKKVGDYETHKTEHRNCEMNQDVHIFNTRMNLMVSLSEHLDSGIKRCRAASGGLDDNIRGLWLEALTTVHPQEAASNAPDPDAWHRHFGFAVDAVESAGWFEPLSRHVLRDKGVIYPRTVDERFIVGLPTPDGGTIDFDPLFDRAKANVHRVWTAIARGILEGDDAFETAIGDWNLDTGKDPNGRLVFW
jgi:hypothetical protein